MLALLLVGTSAVTSTLAFLIPTGTKTMGRAIDLLAMPKASAEEHGNLCDELAGTIPTEKLLSSIIHAALRGSQTINSMCDQARNGTIEFKVEGDNRSALTIADTSAQRVIVSSLLGVYPDLSIVGEEDESVEVDEKSRLSLRDDLLDGYTWATASGGLTADVDEPPSELDLKDLVVFVDPLDGTREFVEGRLNAVQSLIGVCYKGKPLMGAQGLPFPSEPSASKPQAVFGLIGRGVGKLQIVDDDSSIEACKLPDLRNHCDGDTVSLSSGDSASIQRYLDLAEDIIVEKVERKVVGATGNKILCVALGDSTISMIHTKTSLWDSAAPTALLESLGGKVTDYFGNPLVYDAERELGNKFGVIASAAGAAKLHDQLTKALRGDKEPLSFLAKYGLNPEVEEQCIDIARDLDGFPLTKDYLARSLGIRESDVDSYCCPENESVRGLMSNACRIRLQPGDSTSFYKRIEFASLSHARAKMKSAPHKLIRDVKSYRVESSFLASKACNSVIEKAGLRIPRCFDAKLRPNDAEPIQSKFSVLLEDFSPSSGWSQRWLLQDEDECRATLTTFAKLHAFFWTGSSFWSDKEAAKELEEGVWESASYTQPQLQTLNQCKDVAKGWASSRLKCRAELESLHFWDNLGERLESTAEEVGRLAHPFADLDLAKDYAKYKTFTHGDPKQANLFFRNNGNDLEVGLIDFQWAGFGLAATDIAHFITAAVYADVLIGDGEMRLLTHYYDCLVEHLVKYGAFASAADAKEDYSFDLFTAQYETAVLDMCRLVIAYAWSRFEPVSKDDDVACKRTANKNSYNKSMPNVRWLMGKCDSILSSRGV